MLAERFGQDHLVDDQAPCRPLADLSQEILCQPSAIPRTSFTAIAVDGVHLGRIEIEAHRAAVVVASQP